MDNIRVFLSSFFFLVCSLSQFCHSTDTLTKGQSIKDGVSSGKLISTDGNFALGFFSPGNSTLRYVGVWYNKIAEQTVVWVANRKNPISDENGSFSIGSDGNLMVLDGNSNAVWSSNVSNIESSTTAAKLSDNGNFILTSSENIGVVDNAYWQSFEHPTDTYLPGMRVRVNPNMGDNHAFASWKSASDPSLGNYTLGVDPHGAPQIIIWERLKRRWRSGQWNSVIFTGVPETANLASFRLSPPESDGTMYFTYNPVNASDLMMFLISWDGHEEQLIWNEGNRNWTIMQRQPDNECELYNHCGDFGVCNKLESPKCRCMDGFVPKRVEQWNRGNWSDGCVRRTKLHCERNSSVAGQNGGGEDRFKQLKCMKLPDSAVILQSESCEERCLQNCLCTAYAEIAAIGCMIWSGNLVDVQESSKEWRTTLHIRLADSELGKRRISSSIIIAIVAPITVSAVLFVAGYCFLTRRARKKYSSVLEEIAGNDILTAEALQFDFGSIQAATNRFMTDNKLGAGGFGEVYKGVLPNGQEIAVKRLSKRSGQGAEEFKNEVVVVAKLQHRNLVRLQGFCLEGEEKILVYEFVPNKSLDYFLYDTEKRRQLDWPKRYKIIGGIARGILYLHEDSRLRIIHRDLKASNVLLDREMNPKIADFGMARIFGVDQTQGSTNRIVGTYGYMAPEYAMQGQFSVKSDVYSFGVLALEIITGKKNSSFYQTDSVGNLSSYAWELWRDETPMQLLDSNLLDSYSRDEVMRCIHMGLLCVQEDPAARPTMATVVHMLNSYSVSPPLPQQPAFFIGSRTELNMRISDNSTSKSMPWSVDNASITKLCPR